ncbi:PREDICTED: MD-2-related lipid-recognition protein-like [Rhagoletis zephyria]|uniref:MD-2-related lipid-recognition protein-like n=1 Tax=Rhagoletis zephyria TaxID=28612 RepID=UPI00081134A7|nr:PREDICTED: MD-2-related lipid-recognition protein-like [Rhagoletis zephyria]
MSLLKICVLLGVIVLTAAEVVDIKPCGDVDACTIHEARISPCPEALDHKACRVSRRRKSSEMSYDFSTNFDAPTLEAGLAWHKSETQDLPLITMDRNACKYTSCPVVANQTQTYRIDIPLDTKFPMHTYAIKWTLKAPTGQLCCFTTEIKVVR